MAALIISSGASASIHKHALANSGDRILEYQDWIQLVFNKVGGPASMHKQLWHKQLAGGDTAVALLNFGVFDGQHFNASFTTEMVGMSVGAAFKARDLFAKVDLGTRHGSFHAMLEATSILMLRLSPTAIA